MHLFAFKNQGIMLRFYLCPKWCYSKKLYSQECHKFMLFIIKNYFAKYNSMSSNMGCGTKNVRKFHSIGPNVFWTNVENIGYYLVFFNCRNHVYYDER
jgi:hypothetical protein